MLILAYCPPALTVFQWFGLITAATRSILSVLYPLQMWPHIAGICLMTYSYQEKLTPITVSEQNGNTSQCCKKEFLLTSGRVIVKGKCFVQRDVHCKIRSWWSSMRWPRALSHSPSGLGGFAPCSYCKGVPRYLPFTWHLSPSYKDPNLMLFGSWNLPRALRTEPVAPSSAALLLMGHRARHSYCPYLLSHSSLSLLTVAGWGQSLPGLSTRQFPKLIPAVSEYPKSTNSTFFTNTSQTNQKYKYVVWF